MTAGEGAITGGSTVMGPEGAVLGDDVITPDGVRVGPSEIPVVPDNVGIDVSMVAVGINVSMAIVGIGVATFVVGPEDGCGEFVFLLRLSSSRGT